MFRVMRGDGRLIAEERVMALAYQKATVECERAEEDVVVWNDGAISALFVFGKETTITVKPKKSYVIVMVTP